jgi:hypothetical protein
MVRTQIQLPDELYARAKRFADAREMSLAELARRGIETLLGQYPPPDAVQTPWRLPELDLGLKVPLERLREFAAEDETMRSLPPVGE